MKIKMKKEISTEIFICECYSTEHQLVVSYLPGDSIDDCDELSIEIHLSPIYGFWRRLIGGIKYIFGHKSKYGNWESFIFNPKDADKLIVYLSALRDSMRPDQTNQITQTPDGIR